MTIAAHAAGEVVALLRPIVAVHRAERVFNRVLDHDLKAVGLIDREAYTLTLLAEVDGYTATVTELCHAMQLPKSLGTATVRRLEALGLVVRSEHPEDRRKTAVILTAKGKRVEEHATAIMRESFRRRLLPYLKEEELRLLDRLHTVVDAVQRDFDRQQAKRAGRSRQPESPVAPA